MANDPLFQVKLSQNEEFSKNSKTIQVKHGSKYRLSTEIIGEKGNAFSAYFGVVFLNERLEEIERKIKWLNDVSGTKKNVNLIFEAKSEKIIIVYRMNFETPVKSQCHYEILPSSS